MQRVTGSGHHYRYDYKSKRNVMKKYVLLFGLLIQAVSVLAQEASVGKSIFSVHAGASWYLGKMIGITNNSDAYRNDLRNGMPTIISWETNISSVRLNLLPDLSIRVGVIKTLMTKVLTRF